MAKKVNIDEIDAEFIINSFSSHTVAPSTSPPKQENKEAETKVVPVLVAEPKAEPPRKRKPKSQDYEACFLKRSDVVARLGKTVYLQATHHDRMQKMVQTLKKNDVSVSSYLDNIISNHFDTYQDEITELFNQNNQPIFQKEKP